MAGRPTLYKPEYCTEIIEHMKKGFSMESFAGKIGVCTDSIYAWRDVHEEFSEAIKSGKAASRYWWEDRLVQTVDNPKEMNATSVYFALKCRFGYKETQAVEHSGPDGKPIETVNKSELTDEQLTEKIKLLSIKVEGNQ